MSLTFAPPNPDRPVTCADHLTRIVNERRADGGQPPVSESRPMTRRETYDAWGVLGNPAQRMIVKII